MYGTRAAADGWQQEYSSFLKSIGFRQGEACPCLFFNASRNLAISVHGDDFTTVGPKCELDVFERQLEEKYELKKGGRLGPGRDDCKELTVLNRVIRWTDRGIEYEADPRQAERLIEGLNLDSGCKSTATPGLKLVLEKLLDDKPLSSDAHTAFRALAARANYLAQDRIDLIFSAKEVCRFMASPTESSEAALKRLDGAEKACALTYFAGTPQTRCARFARGDSTTNTCAECGAPDTMYHRIATCTRSEVLR